MHVKKLAIEHHASRGNPVNSVSFGEKYHLVFIEEKGLQKMLMIGTKEKNYIKKSNQV